MLHSEEIRITKGHWKQRIGEHDRSTKHQNNVSSGQSRQTSVFNLFQQETEKKNQFYTHLTETFISANISLEKLKQFSFKYTQTTIN